MKKIITFDCYGTLLCTDILYDTIADIAIEHQLSCEKAKQIFTSYEDRLMYGESFLPYDQLLLKALRYCDMEMNTEVFEKQWGRVMENHRRMKPYDDVLPALQALKEKGYRLILMSNTTHQLMDCHRKELTGLIDEAVTAEDVSCYKPDLSFFLYTAARFDLHNAQHCHIAKGYWWDIVPCSKLGWNKIWINRANRKGDVRHQPYQEAKNLIGIENLVP